MLEKVFFIDDSKKRALAARKVGEEMRSLGKQTKTVSIRVLTGEDKTPGDGAADHEVADLSDTDSIMEILEEK